MKTLAIVVLAALLTGCGTMMEMRERAKYDPAYRAQLLQLQQQILSPGFFSNPYQSSQTYCQQTAAGLTCNHFPAY